jgi:hypothetical protein
MAEQEEQPETQEEIVRRVVSEFVKTHSHRDWGPMDCRTLLTFAHQPDAVLAQANPVSTTLYTVLAATPNVRIYGINTECFWTVQPSPLEIVLTIDGQVITHGIANPATATAYFARRGMDRPEANQELSAVEFQPAFFIEGRSVRVQARITGGTVQTLNARVKWARRL